MVMFKFYTEFYYLFSDVYIVGGLYEQTILDDIWKLCLRTFKWTKLSTKLQIPVYFHSADVTPVGTSYI